MERREATDEEARALASALRLRILRICLSEPQTNKEIATTLGKDPATTLHHVRLLTRTGFLEAKPARRGTRGAKEIPYFATRKSWTISTPAKGKVLLDTFLEEAALVPAEELDTARLGLKLTDANWEQFKDRMSALLDEFANLPEDPDGKPWSVFLALHPDPNR